MAQKTLTITTRNARFQQLEALLGNRTKRHRLGEFLLQGVRPINLALDHDWPIRAVIRATTGQRSEWAREVIQTTTRSRDIEQITMSHELMTELAERDEEATPELLVVAEIPDRALVDLTPLASRTDALVVVLDRPTQPGNVGSIIRSADALGADAVVVAGHAADLWDPKCVRASTGSIVTVPTATAASADEVVDWVTDLREDGSGIRIIGTDESGTTSLADAGLDGPTLLVIGNETRGMSAAWRNACDATVAIPIGGAASSLNAANAASILLYESARQRGFPKAAAT